ncbi:PorT family protein, partial [candidate division KSB1 bacterium]|nr:PorT family protein [candidate division KSB1 bacterium]
MKKMSILVGALFTLIAVLPATAQVNFGVIGGLNLANLSVDPDAGVDISNRTAFGIGGILSFGVGETLALQLEPMFLQKGAKLKLSDQGFTLEAEIKVSYIEVPAMLKFAFGSGDTKPYVMAGPTVGWVLSAKVKDDMEEQDIKDDVKNIDFGLAFGGGVSLPMGNNTVFVEGRYSLGLSDINDDSSDDTEIKTKGIQIMAGITFPLGGESYTYKG